jgi:small subunit ribosomal protein S4
MKLGPRYKIARRLGAPIFEKTQTQKFKLQSEAKKGPGAKRGGMMKTDFGRQMLEKQKARFTYGISEKQFSKYVKNVIESKSHTPTNEVFVALETRLDNVVARLAIVSTRRFARQVVSHGHILVNGRKVTVPSYVVRAGDKISVREGSKSTAIFKEFEAKIKEIQTPIWLTWDTEKKVASVLKMPSIEGQDLLFDLGAVIEFYKR